MKAKEVKVKKVKAGKIEARKVKARKECRDQVQKSSRTMSLVGAMSGGRCMRTFLMGIVSLVRSYEA